MKACKKCKRLTQAKRCPACGSDELTTSWKGRLIVIDPDKSEIAKFLGIQLPGEYALQVRS